MAVKHYVILSRSEFIILVTIPVSIIIMILEAKEIYKMVFSTRMLIGLWIISAIAGNFPILAWTRFYTTYFNNDFDNILFFLYILIMIIGQLILLFPKFRTVVKNNREQNKK